MDTLKILLVICDGMGDRPCDALKGMTPLEAALTPNMNRVASEGISGMMDVIGPGTIPGSDTAHLALLGYDPIEVYTGRGPFEAAGEGLEVRRGDVAFRCNFATVDGDMTVVDRRAGRISSGTDELAAALDGMEIGDVRVLFKAGVEHRAVLVLRGPGLDPGVSDVDPHAAGKVLQARALSPGAGKTAEVLNEFTRRAHEILEGHEVNAGRIARGEPPANIVLARGAGSPPDVPGFSERHGGMSAAAVVGISLVKGVCRVSGMDVPEAPGATGSTDTDLDAKVRAALFALDDHDFALLHIKGTDLYGHDNDPRGKVEFIERIDRALAPLLDLDDTVLCITADHSTPCAVGDHAADPVPVVISGPGQRRDRVMAFSELDAMSGGLGHIRGNELLGILRGMAGRSGKFGA